jgi:hypothetical protein
MTEWKIIASRQRFPAGPVFTPDGTLWWVEVEGAGFGWFRDGQTGHVAIGGRCPFSRAVKKLTIRDQESTPGSLDRLSDLQRPKSFPAEGGLALHAGTF